MAAPASETRFAEYLPFWNLVLGRWASGGAWYGLHGHIYMGCLASLNSMVRVRELMRERSWKDIPPEQINHPGGALGSAHYSIAKLMPDRNARKQQFDLALRNVETSLAANRHSDPGLFAIRGSIYLQRGDTRQAIEDYEAVLKIRERDGESQGGIGEAMSELGFGYIRQGRFFKGRDYLVKGVRSLTESERPGFLIRAKKKLAIAHALTGHPILALREHAEANKLAREKRMFDQI
jgi:tetratricopeptide (TPR) repeat protein